MGALFRTRQWLFSEESSHLRKFVANFSSQHSSFTFMTRIASDFFYDLTPKATPHMEFSDFFETEMFHTKQQNQAKNNSQNSIIIKCETSPRQNNDFSPSSSGTSKDFSKPLHISTKFSKSSERFRFAVIKTCNSQQLPTISKSHSKFHIVRIPKKNQTDGRQTASDQIEINHLINYENESQFKGDANYSDEIINLF